MTTNTIAPTTAAARAEHATKVYGSGDTAVRALDDVTVEMPMSRLTAIMGPSGSGKSTLMHCMAGLDTLTGGQVLIGDQDLAALSDQALTHLRRDRIGFVFQAFNLIPTLSAIENIRLPFTLAGRKPDAAWLDEVVATVGLHDRLDHRPNQLSGGQQQRVAVARAVATRPDIVFADEPTGNLDSRAGAEILGFLRRAVDDLGQTVAMVTHDPVAAAYADAVVFLADGRVVDHMPEPTAERVLDRIKNLGVEMLKLSLFSLWARRRRLVSTGIAVVLGVAFLTGTLVLGDTLKANFDRLFTQVSAGTNVVVRNGNAITSQRQLDDDRGVLSQSLVRTIRNVEGVATAEGTVAGYGSLLGRDGEPIGGNGPPRLAGSWIDDPQLNPYQLVAGRAPRAADEVVINRGAAQAGDLKLGDSTVLQAPQPIPVKIVGIATFGDADGLGTATFTAFTLAAAQEQITRRPGEVSTIVVRAEPGVSDAELRDRIRAELPSGVEAITGQQLTDERIDDISSTFLNLLRTFLVVFAGIALVVATLSINNTFTITVAQRTRELALLRAVGASRRQVRWSVGIEGLLIGAVAAAIGAVGGLGVAGLLKGMFDSFGFALPAGGLTINASALAIGFAAGLIATFVAAQLPARRASSVAPLAALQSASAETAGFDRRRVLAGVGVLVVGAIAAGFGAATGSFLPAGLGGLALVVGALFVAPVLLPPAARAIGAVLRRVRGVSGMLAEQNARRNPRRSAATATALVIGVTVVSLFTLFTASLSATLDSQVRAGVTADLIVSAPSFGGGRLSPELVEQLDALPEVGQAVGLGGGPVRIDGKTMDVVATNPATLPDVMKVDTITGSLTELGDQGIAISKGQATDEHWKVGTPITVTFGGGVTEQVTVRAIYDDSDLLSGIVVPSALWNRHALQPTESAVLMTLAPGVSEAAARTAVTPLADRNGGDVQDLTEYADASTGGLDTLLNIVYVMLALAIVIALLGIANTLSLAVYERRTELGLLRAVGETRRQVRSMLRLESVILATFGTALGLVLGGVLGWVLFITVSADGTFAVPAVPIIVIALLGAAAGVLAALRPARRAAKLPILESIATA